MIKIPTDEQNNVLECDGNIVITAKPGSGKTFTIVEKIARILPRLPDYKGIIAISFTNKASDELKKRCKQRCVDTKQSFFGTIDRFYISQIIIPFACHITGKKPEYAILDDVPAEGKYSSLRNLQWPLTNREKSLLFDALSEGKIFLKLTGETAYSILESAPGAIIYLKARYSHIFVDEYQDCGRIQNDIFAALIENGLLGIAVGDINQAIYGFANRFPKYLISLVGRKDFNHFELSRNHRCHEGIAEYSLCLFNASKQVPEEKRVFLVSVSGDEHQIASAIDSHINAIKRRYNVSNNNSIAILCRSNNSIARVDACLSTPHKVFEDTILDKDNSEWGRFFRIVLTSRFEEEQYAPDFAAELFSEEYEPVKYRKALSLSQTIFACTAEKMALVESEIAELAELVFPQKRNSDALKKLHTVLSSPEILQNYIPATNDEINLMTLHKSKGLEFNIVFHLDLYKWVFPNEYDSDEAKIQDLNLHYVGITRAKDACYIVNGTQRFRSKNNDYIKALPSPFLEYPGVSERRIDVVW